MKRIGKFAAAANRRILLTAGCASLALTAGCLNDDGTNADASAAGAFESSGETWVEAWDDSGRPALPTLAQLQSALGLNDAQSAVVGTALNDWQQAVESRMTSARERRGNGHGMPGGFGDFEPPLLGFLEAVVPALESGQVSSLALFLESQHAQGPGGGDRPQPAGRGPGNPGGVRGPGGPGGPGGPRGPGGPGGPLGFVLAEIREELDLDEAQRTALRTALHDSREAFHSLRMAFRAGEISAEELRDGAIAARVALEAELASILSESQLELLTNTLAEHRAEVATRRLERLDEGADRRLTFLTTILSLDAGQTAQIEGILAASIEQRRALLESLRDGAIEIEEALYQGYLIAESTADAIRAVLTPEQQTIFDALKTLLPGHRGPRG